VVDLRTEQPSLEDVFMAYYAGGAPGRDPARDASVEEESEYASA